MDMANVRITDQTTDTALQSGDYVIVDSQSEGTRKFDLGGELRDIKEDLSSYNTRITALEQGGSGSGLTEDIKTALLQLAAKVAYIDDDGQDYYDDLEDALYPPAPPATLSYITCVYTQSGTVYDTDTLNSLKSDLVVTAHYSNGTTGTVTNYTLSGTLTAGTSTITVSYSGKTTTFTVTVTHAADPSEEWTDGVPYTINLIQNEYINNTNGVITSYNGWDRTDYLPCHGAAAISVSSINLGAYNAWYDASKEFIDKFTISTSTTQILVPSNAAYFIASGSRANMAQFAATPHETAEE